MNRPRLRIAAAHDAAAESFAIGPRKTLHRGDTFRATGGTRFNGREIGPRGVFRLLRVRQIGTRTYLDALHIASGGQYTLLVAGRPYAAPHAPEIRLRPFRITAARAAKGTACPR